MKLLTLISSLFPNIVAIFLLRILGHKVSWKAIIGFSLIYSDTLFLEDYSKIGNFNIIKTNSIHLKQNALVGSLNIFKGSFKMFLDSDSRIQKNNKFTSGYFPITYGNQELVLGKGTGITSNNYFDLTNSITFGENCQVAGINSQFWTHGYMHADKGKERIRIDGEIIIGNNVYIGSRCLFNPGVKVADAINIGGNSVISKDLKEPGMYVNQTLRHIKTDINITRQKFKKVSVGGLIEEIYTKNNK